ncbi:hypothetical protein GCM10022214_75390 [Actinomadura miaoliensis]|uniref:Nudix hydrolase domain-containing protein n=2 Tax=Actinomadura miaoliensis TaxID=430685 RepID=A0ABP7WZW0_9ACTN
MRRLRDDADRDGTGDPVVGAVVHERGRVLVLRRSEVTAETAWSVRSWGAWSSGRGSATAS